MTHILTYLAGIVTGAALLVVLGALQRSRADAGAQLQLRTLRALHAEQRRTIERLQQQHRQHEIIIIGLVEGTVTLEPPPAPPRISDDVLGRFNWN